MNKKEVISVIRFNKTILQKLDNLRTEPANCEEMLKRITFGVPARNEEVTINQTIDSLINSIKFLPLWVDWELLICLNGCWDNTEYVVDQLINRYKKENIELKKIVSEEGKIEAQRKIVQKRKHKEGIIFFFDADVVVDKLCVPILWFDFFSSSQLQVSYATVVACSSVNSLMGKIMDFYHKHPEIRSKRNYFHGRAFGVRNWDAPDFTDLNQITLMQKRVIIDKKLSYLQLEKGPLIDDVYLSRQIIHKYGLNSVKQNLEAVVYFTPLSTMKDYFYGYRRLWIEIERLDILFPEHKYLQKEYFSRRIKWEAVKNLTLEKKLLFMADKMIEKGARSFYYVTNWIHKFRVCRSSQEIWKSLKSTKKCIPDSKLRKD